MVNTAALLGCPAIVATTTAEDTGVPEPSAVDADETVVRPESEPLTGDAAAATSTLVAVPSRPLDAIPRRVNEYASDERMGAG
jgi:hypothetical protein